MSKKFKRLEVDFFIPAAVETAIDDLETAILTEDPLWDCYLDELRATIHGWQDCPGGFSEEEGDELIHYYYGRYYELD